MRALVLRVLGLSTLQRDYDWLVQEYEDLRKKYNATLLRKEDYRRAYEIMKSSQHQIVAPNDSQYCKLFAELEREYKAMESTYLKAIQENGTLKRRLAAWDELLEKVRG